MLSSPTRLTRHRHPNLIEHCEHHSDTTAALQSSAANMAPPGIWNIVLRIYFLYEDAIVRQVSQRPRPDCPSLLRPLLTLPDPPKPNFPPRSTEHSPKSRRFEIWTRSERAAAARGSNRQVYKAAPEQRVDVLTTVAHQRIRTFRRVLGFSATSSTSFETNSGERRVILPIPLRRRSSDPAPASLA